MNQRWLPEEDALLRKLVEAKTVAEAAGLLVQLKTLGREIEYGPLRRRATRLGGSLGAVANRAIRMTSGRAGTGLNPAGGRIDNHPPAGGPEEAGVLPDRFYVEKPEPAYKFEPLCSLSGVIERILLVPDTHAPYHDQRAWDVMVKYARHQFRPDTIVHLGDFADCYAVSDHDKDPRRMSQIEDEMKLVRELREELESLDAARHIVTLGNHEDRFRRLIVRQAPALFSSLSIEELMGFNNGKWGVVPYRQHAKLGHLYLTHECGFWGENATKRTGETFASSVAFGHSHRAELRYFGDITGRRHVAANLGWLGSMPKADYEHDIKKMVRWQHAFGVATMGTDGLFEIQIKPIVDGRIPGSV